MTLGQASELLGVHRSTLRRWADHGRVSCRRTAGGHRRFDRRTLQASVEGHRAKSAEVALDPPVDVDRSPAWRSQLQDAEQVAQLREMGQRLSGIVIQFLGRDDADDRLLSEAGRLGHEYADRSLQAGMTVDEAVEAFLYYRASLVRLLIHAPEFADGDESRYERYDRVVSAVLLGLVRGYANRDHP